MTSGVGATRLSAARDDLRDLFDQLDTVRPSLNPPSLPLAGSALASDDRAWSWWPISAITWAKFSACADHLQAVRVLCDADSFHSTATFSLTRSALLTASQAVWMLGPDDPAIRQVRALHVAATSNRERLKWLRLVAQGEDAIWPKLSVARGHIAMREMGMVMARAQLPKTGPTGETDVITHAADRVQPGSLPWKLQAEGQWRAAGSDAHGLVWGSMARGATPVGPSAGSLHVITVAGDPVQTYRNFYVAFQTFLWAWRRWHDLGDVPLPNSP